MAKISGSIEKGERRVGERGRTRYGITGALFCISLAIKYTITKEHALHKSSLIRIVH